LQEPFELSKDFPKVGLVFGDPPFGLNLADWDDKAPPREALVNWFKSLVSADWVHSKFVVFLYCSSQMIGDILSAGREAGCSSNPQHLSFISDQGCGGRCRNAFHTHLIQHAVVLFFDKERPGKGGDRGAFGFDLTKVSDWFALCDLFAVLKEPMLSIAAPTHSVACIA